jgi:hypothetical protein
LVHNKIFPENICRFVSIKKKICGVLVFAFFAIAFFLMVRPAARPEPIVQGKIFSWWFAQAESMPNYVFTADSTKAIYSMGDAAIPLLTERACHEDPWWFGTYVRHYSKFPRGIQKMLPPPDNSVVRQLVAAELLAKFGHAARVAVPDLIKAYGESSRKYLGLPPGHIDWARQLTNPAPLVISAAPVFRPGGYFQMWALKIIADEGSDDPQVIPLLLSSLHLPDSNLHGLVLEGMKNNTNFNTAIQHSQSILLIALTDYDPVVRAAAADMLAMLAPGHPEIVPALLKALADQDNYVRESAMKALAKSNVPLRIVLPVVAGELAESNGDSQRNALVLLFHASGGGTNLLNSLETAVDDSDASVRIAAVQAIEYLGSRAKATIPKLTQHTLVPLEPDERVRDEAANALKKITHESVRPGNNL